MLRTHTAILKLADDDPKSLGISRIQPGVTCRQGLVEGVHYAIDTERGTIRRLQPFGRELYTFDMLYEDGAEAKVAEEQARSAALVKAQALAQSAVGVNIQNLTAAQVRALLACLLWQAGAIMKDGIVRPLGEWLR